MLKIIPIREAYQHIQAGAVIVYPTESVFGMGCNPLSEGSVGVIRSFKGRAEKKAFILVVSDFDQVRSWIEGNYAFYPYFKKKFDRATTLVFPASKDCPPWLIQGGKIAVRQTTHDAARQLCMACGPLISTSVNRGGEVPAMSHQDLEEVLGLGDMVSVCVEGDVGAQAPSLVLDANTGFHYRA